MEIKPVRLQRSRQHKMVSPNGLSIIYVGRPSEWGNPFSFKRMGREEAVRLYEQNYARFFNKEELKKSLGGKNLACWCTLDQACHGDVLLRLAND